MFGWGKGSWSSAEPSATGEAEAPGGGLETELEHGPSLPKPRLLESLLRFEKAPRRRSPEAMRACFHDDALVESVASRGEALGPDDTLEALARAFEDGVYSVRDWRYEE